MLEDIIKSIKKLEVAMERLQAKETSRLVMLNQLVRVKDDSTVRAAGYSTAVQITGVGGLPSKIKGILYTGFFTPTNANTSTGLIVENPSYLFGGFSVVQVSSVAGVFLSGGGAASLDNNGQVQVTIRGGTDRWGLDVWAYLI